VDLMRRTILGVGAISALSPVVAAAALPGAAEATPSYPCISPHCYSVEKYVGAQGSLTGLWFQESDNNMSNGNTGASPYYHINSEGWYLENAVGSTTDYIEVGLTNEYEGSANGYVGSTCSCLAYAQFWADTHYTAPGVYTQWEHLITNLTPDGVNHTYQIVRGATANHYNIELDGNVVGSSGATNQWAGSQVAVGGEYYGPYVDWGGSFANTFDIYHKTYNSTGGVEFWPAVSGTQVDPGFNARLWNGNNTYSWNMP